jgi:uncharacterized membrane protein YkvA (DUF1232 family)
MPREPRGFRAYRSRAGRLLGRPADVARLLQRVGARLTERRSASAALAQARQELATFVALIDAWRRGEYRGVERSSLVLVTAALLYFVAPLDALPDVLLGIGLLDDAAVIGFVYARLQGELDAFRTWRDRQREGNALPPATPPLPPPGPE